MDGFKVASENSPLLKGTGLKNGDVIKLPTSETDGAPVKKILLPGSTEIPEIDNDKLNFYKTELVAFDFTLNPYNKPGIGTFIVFKKTETSGTVVNTSSDNWCSFLGIGGKDKTKIQAITKNMIDLSLNHQSLFKS
ncbi:MAG: hypothetical protein JKY70_09255 [Mucilaginibacter sp.]|nr:hypothetical protein [Mucilaginibacter sp.]